MGVLWKRHLYLQHQYVGTSYLHRSYTLFQIIYLFFSLQILDGQLWTSGSYFISDDFGANFPWSWCIDPVQCLSRLQAPFLVSLVTWLEWCNSVRIQHAALPHCLPYGPLRSFTSVVVVAEIENQTWVVSIPHTSIPIAIGEGPRTWTSTSSNHQSSNHSTHTSLRYLDTAR